MADLLLPVVRELPEAVCEQGCRTSAMGLRNRPLRRGYLPLLTGGVVGDVDAEVQSSNFASSVIALDPTTGKVYAFGEGDPLDSYTQLHRDVESLVYALHLFRKFDEMEREDDSGVEEQVERLRARIEAFDPLPFEDEQSQWTFIFDVVIDGIW
ncbi:SUKH-4 family immunity protein [Streptomyces sp. NPDC053813]|uniref:SUKH-4 family immunity protein n=1 Tax=Streptomyces sp. NPDC053813 TaxID=3365717 RepID=UPI0037CFF62E